MDIFYKKDNPKIANTFKKAYRKKYLQVKSKLTSAINMQLTAMNTETDKILKNDPIELILKCIYCGGKAALTGR